MIEYRLIKEQRKTIGIYITKEAEVLVKAPKLASQKAIDNFVNQKANWIDKHLTQKRAVLSQEPKYKLEYNGKILLLGKEIPIIKMKEKGMNLTEEALYIQENADFDKVVKVFQSLIRDFAIDYYSQRLNYYGNIMNLKNYNLKVNNAKSQWGSCNSRKVISLSLRLIGADKDLIDYVIVHELAHLVYMDHQKDFWNLVESIIPDYKLRRKALKQYQLKITPETFI